eukprot:gene10871-10953_t
MTRLRVVLGDQLSENLSSLADLGPADVVLMAEVLDECRYVPHHVHKITLVLSAMRHFAEHLRGNGVMVDYRRLDDPQNTHSLRGEVIRAAAEHAVTEIVVTEPGEYRVLADMRSWPEGTGCPVDIRQDDRFLCGIGQFRDWAAGRKSLRMEFFYRDMRRGHEILLDEDGPVGGQWNYDSENRKRLPKDIKVPATPRFPPDAITQDVMRLVAERFPDNIGNVDNFALPVTRAQALVMLEDFIARRLADFGNWQDAMKTGAPHLFHSLVSTSLNLGLLGPLEICRAAEDAYRQRAVPLNAVEGFIRQILGWREYIRGIYWLKMPEYGRLNALGAHRKLPWFYWSGETRMRCMQQAVAATIEHAYAHHIQRLMVTGNFALLAGIDPAEVDEWYLAVYADAYEWVEMPNTRGMALFADGGIVGSKPYAASGAYINKMSDHCSTCHYSVKDSTGPRGCPFNALYWDFIARHQERFAGNNRMAMPLMTLAGMTAAKPADGIAWITGASTGIGAAVATKLVQDGWTVAITARAADKLEALAAKHPGKMIVAPGDVTDAPGMKALATRIEAEGGRKIALAILNAGAWQEMGAEDFDFASFRTQFEVNVIGTAACIEAVMPAMMARKSGQIAVVASVAGYRGLPRAVAYGATKAALIAMSESLRFDLMKRNVTMTVVNPGFVRTPMTDRNTFKMPFLLEPEDAAARIVRGLASGRFEVAFPWQLVAKWGNSLAVRLPAAVVEALELKEGDDIEIHVADARSFEVARKPSREELLNRLRAFRGRLPADFRFFDTNVLVYLASDDEPKANRAEELLQTGGIISVQVLNELTNVARRKMRLSWPETRIFLATLRDLLTVEPLTIEVHEQGLRFAERFQLSVYDAMIVSSAISAGCDTLFSEDMHNGLAISEHLRIVNPFLPAS